ncbi:MAG: hypothetical protein ABSE73_16600 [Planctomycetota bacterium]
MSARRTRREIAADKYRTGRRPALSEPKTIFVGLRITKGELTTLRNYAQAHGVTLSDALMAPHRQKEEKR